MSTPDCGCDYTGYCQRHDYTLVCWIEGCDLPFPHLPVGAPHRPECGCTYDHGGSFAHCQDHTYAFERMAAFRAAAVPADMDVDGPEEAK